VSHVLHYIWTGVALKADRGQRRFRSLRYIDSLETETHIYIATERVRPLSAALNDFTNSSIIPSSSHRERAKQEWLAWGLKSLSTGLAFINAAPLLQHHALLGLDNGSVWVTPALEWRLGGFEVLTGMEDGQGVLWGAGGLIGKEVGEVSAPEVRKSGWGVLREWVLLVVWDLGLGVIWVGCWYSIRTDVRSQDPALSDTYLLALLIYQLYNPDRPLPNLSAAPQLSTIGSVPKSLFPVYKRMLNPNAKTRLATTRFVSEVEPTGYWQGNNLIELVNSLEGFELAGEADKISLLRRIRESQDILPPPFLISKILPSLLHSLSLPSAPASHILPLVLSIGKNVPPHRYTATVLDPVVRLYASPDRGTRMALLEGLAEYGEKLEKGMVVDKVWPHLITGFADTVAVIREATVKAIPIIAPKVSSRITPRSDMTFADICSRWQLNDRLLNNDLLRLLAKMQVDPEPSIRTNTCILLGRLAPLLGPNTKKKVLVPAFARSLKDTFVHARVAGLMALMATVEFYDKDDIAGRVIPNMAFTMIDKEKWVVATDVSLEGIQRLMNLGVDHRLVRDQAFKAMQVFMGKLEAAAAAMVSTIVTARLTSADVCAEL
jgi:SCY1-like protein 1